MSSYDGAKRCFEENVKLISPAGNDRERLIVWSWSYAAR
jgi:hypothetical protein